MYVAEVQRSDLVHLGSSRPVNMKVLRASTAAPRPKRCLLVWLSDEQNLMPDVIVVPDGDTEDFFAWANAYLTHLLPLSALLRVVEHGEFRSSLLVSGLSRAGDRRLRAGLVGLVHAEVVAACHGSFPPMNAGLTPYTSTLSWVLLQLARRDAAFDPADVADRWTECRDLLGARPVSYRVGDIVETWQVILGAVVASNDSSASDLAGSVQKFILSPARAVVPSSLAFDNRLVEDMEALRQGPLEKRVELFSDLMDQMPHRSDCTNEYAALAGFCLSLISQGSFEHIALAATRRRDDIRVLLWYAWFEFSREELMPGTHAWSNVSLRLLRLSTPESTYQRSDISLEELRILGRMPRPLSDVPIDLRHPIDVEIARGVACRVRAEFGRWGEPTARGRERRSGRGG